MDGGLDRKVNVDHLEIAKFAGMGNWWDPAGPHKSLHDINPLRLSYIDRRMSLSGKQVLDVGCGGGLLSEAMAAAGAVVTGIDMGPAPLAEARAHLKISGRQVDYRRISVEKMSLSFPGFFDATTCMELLEHVPDPAAVTTACAALVKPGGNVFFATINRTPVAWLFAVFGGEYLLRLIPRGTHRYDRFRKPDEVRQWAQRSGLVERDRTGMTYNPFRCRYALNRNIRVNYLMHFQKPAG
jgi:2-polyprenyl-6-hydroxyphenyl methylase / 3-demethylubiquinone-9 3-methyltransferase